MSTKRQVTLLLFSILLAVVLFPAAAFAGEGDLAVGESDMTAQEGVAAKAMHRVYNPNSGEHFYTADMSERNNLVWLGWKYEGIGWIAPQQGDPVYRLYNANGGEHHYTLDTSERDALIACGWKDEGVGWYSDPSHAVGLHREYNPNAFANNHNYTTDSDEHKYLVSIGWRDEGIGWYALNSENIEPSQLSDYDVELAKLNGWWQSGGEVGSRWMHIVNGVVYKYRYYTHDLPAYNYGLGPERLIRIETIASLSRFGTGAAKYWKSAGYQLQIEYSANKYQSYLHFDDIQDGLTCSELDGRHYSGGGSYSRVQDANVEPGLLALARANE